MKTLGLYESLIQVYTQENLNKISHQLVDAYRLQDFSYLDRLATSIQASIPIKADKINKLFSQLIMLYHPDRLAFYKKEINSHNQKNTQEKLSRFTHIFEILKQIDKLGPIKAKSCSRSAGPEPDDSVMAGERVDWNEVIYDAGQDIGTSSNGSYDFISALKQKEYGNLDVVYRKQDLANTEGDLELSGYHIRDLSGLEHCTHIVTLDLSYNHIFDITSIGYLHLLEELDLSFNQISQIQVLSELEYLRILDLSFNHIQDMKALFDLNHLEYVNVVGNPIPKEHIDILRKKGTIVVR